MQVDFKKSPVARRVQKRGQKKKAHYVAPASSGRLLQLESRLEASAAVVLGLDPRVNNIRSQPVCFDMGTGQPYASKQELFQLAEERASCPIAYTPDFEASVRGVPIYLEVKHSALIAREPKILRYPRILARHGYRLIIVDENVLADTFVRNMRLLSIARRHEQDTDHIKRSVEGWPEETALGDLVEAGCSQQLILASIGRGHLTCDLRSARISRSTVVKRCHGQATHLMEMPLEL